MTADEFVGAIQKYIAENDYVEKYSEIREYAYLITVQTYGGEIDDLRQFVVLLNIDDGFVFASSRISTSEEDITNNLSLLKQLFTFSPERFSPHTSTVITDDGLVEQIFMQELDQLDESRLKDAMTELFTNAIELRYLVEDAIQT